MKNTKRYSVEDLVDIAFARCEYFESLKTLEELKRELELAMYRHGDKFFAGYKKQFCRKDIAIATSEFHRCVTGRVPRTTVVRLMVEE